MPLKCGDVGGNISEMVHSGRPQRQAVAASLNHERRCRRKMRRARRRRRRRGM
jgi:hypothetical protein